MIDYGYCCSEACWGDQYMDNVALRKVMQGIRDIGGSRVRIGVQVGTWADLDRAINTAVEFGLKPLVCNLGNQQLQPNSVTNALAFGALCKAIALRYGPSGTNQVSEYEIYNEANVSLNPPQVSTPAAFTEFLKAGYTAIKSVHTSSTVIAGGTIPSPKIDFAPVPILFPPFIVFGSSVNPVDWYTGIYAAGGRNYMDALGFHLYADVYPTPSMTQWKYMTDLRDVMVANNDSAKKIWVTEVGTSNPGPGITDEVTARDWLKAMVEGIESYSWTGPFFVYNYRNSTNDTTSSTGNNYGMVTYDFQQKVPTYAYAATIRGTGTVGGDTGDHTPPSAPTGLTVSDVTSSSATFTWNPSTDNVGVTDYRLYLNGTKAADVAPTSTTVDLLAFGTSFTAWVTALDAAGNESTPSSSKTFTTDTPTGQQAAFGYTFTGTGSTLPTVFAQLGLGFSVSGGVALPTASGTDGDFWTVAPYNLSQQSADHSAEIAQAIGSAYSDRAAFALVRMSADGAQWVATGIYDNGKADACVLLTMSAGVVTLQSACNTTPLLATERLRVSALGNIYTVVRIDANNVGHELLTWTDVSATYAGAANRRTGLGWRHKRVGGVNYPPPGIAAWKSSDVAGVQPSPGVSDAWMFAVVDESDWDQLIATNLWETSV